MQRFFRTLVPLVLWSAILAGSSLAQSKKPNLLIIWGDDVGMFNISAYHRGLMGGATPNIDRIAREGMIFMGHYAQASCTAGRAPSSPASTRFEWAWPPSVYRARRRA